MERFKVLGTLLVLDEFSIRDVAEFCDVKEATVRTVFERNRHLLERVGERGTGRPGGKYSVYRVRKEMREKIRADLAALHKALPPGPVNPAFEPPLGLSAAEDALRSVAADDELPPMDRRNALKMIRIDLDVACADLLQQPQHVRGTPEFEEALVRYKTAEGQWNTLTSDASYPGVQNETEQVIIVNATKQEETDSNLTGRVVHAFSQVSSSTPTVIEIDYQKDISGKVTFPPIHTQSAHPSSVIFTLDSLECREDDFLRFMTEVVERYSPQRPPLVLDVNFNSELQNSVLRRQALYQGDADNIETSALSQFAETLRSGRSQFYELLSELPPQRPRFKAK